MDYQEILSQIECYAKQESLDTILIQAIAIKESGLNPVAMRYEPHWQYLVKPADYAKTLGITEDTEINLQKFSYGVMQTMGSVARELGYRHMLSGLLEPSVSIEYGIRKILQIKTKYSKLEDIISAYNAGSCHCIHGIYSNQSYVKDVMYHYNKLSLEKGGTTWIG